MATRGRVVRMGAKEGVVGRFGGWRKPLVQSVKLGAQETATRLQDIRTRTFKVGWREHKGSPCNSRSSIQWASKLPIPSAYQPGEGYGKGREWIRLVFIQHVQSLSNSRWRAGVMPALRLWTSAILLSRCNHFLVISSSPLKCSAGMWSQMFWETKNPLHQTLNLHLDYVILFLNTFNGLLLPSTFILRRQGLLKSPHNIVWLFDALPTE